MCAATKLVSPRAMGSEANEADMTLSVDAASAADPCLNCGVALVGRYCHGCGQKALVHRSVTAFGHDLVHGIWHFDGKLWRTLPMLMLWPGELTRAYIDGQRARFLSPLSMFLFAVFLTFAVFGIFGLGQSESQPGDQVTARPPARSAQGANVNIDLGGEGGIVPRLRGNFSILNATSDIPLINDVLAKARENPSLMFYKLQNSAYKYAWAMIPLSALFLWLLYPFNRRFGLYDHLVFVTYSLCFMLLLLVVLRLASALLASGWIVGVMTLVPIAHIYRQLRGTYGDRRLAAALRTVAVLIGALIILIAFMAALLALGAWD